VADQNEAVGAADAARAGRPARVQIWKALAQETQSGLGSPAEMLITNDLCHTPVGLGTVGTKVAFKSHSRPHLPQTPAASF
jgi:hypothetical protein